MRLKRFPGFGTACNVFVITRTRPRSDRVGLKIEKTYRTARTIYYAVKQKNNTRVVQLEFFFGDEGRGLNRYTICHRLPIIFYITHVTETRNLCKTIFFKSLL